MAQGRTIAFALSGMVLGAIAGGLAGLVAGLAYTTLAETSNFEGYAGVVVVYWIFAGLVIGLFAGLSYGMKLARRQR